MPATRLPPALPRAAAAAALLLATASAAPAADAAPCERHLKPSHTYHANRQTFTTDRLGRPTDALAKTLVDRAAPRTGCQTTVGDWGGRGDWNGGHLIAASFGGVGKRYNLAPMRGRQINQDLMKRVEDAARACLEGDGSVADYRVRLHYPDDKTVTPDTIHMTMAPKVSGVARRITLTLPNEALSGGEMKTWKTRIAKAFQTARCGGVSPGRR